MLKIRLLINKLFTCVSGFSVVLMIAALIVILGPIFAKGLSAVFFTGTVEFREMQFAKFDRGNRGQLATQKKSTDLARKPAYEIFDRFCKNNIDEDVITDTLKNKIHRPFCKKLSAEQNSDATSKKRKRKIKKLKRYSGKILKHISAALETDDQQEAIEEALAAVTLAKKSGIADDKIGAQYLPLTTRIAKIIKAHSPKNRKLMSNQIVEIRDSMKKILGPRPGQILPALERDQFGATRWEYATRYRNDLLYYNIYVLQPDKTNKLVRKKRADLFAGSEMLKFFEHFENNLEKMMLPESTVYWNYFTDTHTSGYTFGGVGPEVVGTLTVTVLSMLFAFPLGLITAAFLAEVKPTGKHADLIGAVLKVIRTCINTLAGVPSIVFGLFGLAFFVLYLQPKMGMKSESSILAGAMTLAILILPVIIRASEEAIRAVPRYYREASLALGASKLRTFLTVTFPASLPGILTGVILAMSRAAGETAPLIFTAVAATGAMTKGIDHPTQVLSYGSFEIVVGDITSMNLPHKQYGMVMSLILIVLILNLSAIIIRSRVSKKLRG